VIAGRHRCHARSDLLNDTGGFVAQDRGERDARYRTLHDVEAGVTDPAGGDAEQYLATARRVEVDVYHPKWLHCLEQDCGTHQAAGVAFRGK